MTMTTWHVPDEVLERFAVAPRSLDPATASSTEAHLLTCGRCRGTVAAAVPTPELDATWAAIADRVDAPRPGPIERVLAGLGIRPEAARLVAATPALQLGWLASVVVVTTLAVLAAYERDSRTLFLVLAPVLPLGSVAVSFVRGAEPGGEAVFAAPLSGTALVLRRATAVVATSFVCVLVGAFALPGLEPVDAAWVLPALALAAAALAGATWWPVEQVATGLVAAWAIVVMAVAVTGPPEPDISPLWAAPGQAAALVLALVAAATAVTRRDRLAVPGGF